jgi:Fe-S cluster biogenesis protein NfuA
MIDLEKSALLAEVELALNDIRPHLLVDGGNVEIVDITDEGILQIKWMGNCESCNMSLFTMKAGIEQAVKSKVPRITGIQALNGLN